MHAISVKELREKLPFIRSELKKGTHFLVIYKSQPIAQLMPIRKKEIPDIPQEATDEALERTAMVDWAKECPPLTEEEVKYYLSLPPYKK